mgnify:CR=1 FL=1
MLDPQQTAFETFVELTGEADQLVAEGVEAALLGLAGDLGELPGRDGAEGLLDDRVEAMTARFEGALEQPSAQRRPMAQRKAQAEERRASPS